MMQVKSEQRLFVVQLTAEGYEMMKILILSTCILALIILNISSFCLSSAISINKRYKTKVCIPHSSGRTG